MDVISSETSEENGNRERPVRTRRSSILKPPRSPLQDLKNGSERVQESNTCRNKKNSRRVSFADTIKVFQTESHIDFERKSENADTETGENVPYIQNKNLDNCCEISGMDTLLCAPIQTQMQHREVSIIEYNHERKHENDQTVIFSDENHMDLTASHTVMINNDLLDCTKGQKSKTIDTTSFLANLKLHSEDSRMKNELKISMDQSTSSEKKINFNDFIKNMKTEKLDDFSSNKENYSPFDKENYEMHIYSKNSNRTSSTCQKHASLKADENSTNITRLFREQDDGMNFTQCHTANIQTLVSSSNEARLREFKCNDTTIYGNDLMDLTVNHTIQILPSAKDNLSMSENQTTNVLMDHTTHHGTNIPEKKTVFENKLNDGLNPECKAGISRSHNIGTEINTIIQPSNQEETLTMIPESIHSSPTRQDYKTVFYSSCNDAMELTKCISGMKEKNLLNHDSDFSSMYPNPDAKSLFIDKTIYSGETSMDITKSHTVAIDNQIFKQDQTDMLMAVIPVSEKEMLKKNLTISENREMIVNCSSVSHAFKERLQQSQENPLSTSLINKNTEIFVSEDMNLTETNLGSQAHFTSSNLASENICNDHSHSKNSSGECVFLSGQSTLKNSNAAVNSCTVKSVLDQNSKLPEPPRRSLGNPIPGYSLNKVIDCSEENPNMDLTKNHTIVIELVSSEVRKLGKNNLENTNSQLTTVNRQVAVDVEIGTNVSVEKSGVFMANDIIDGLEVKSVQEPGLLDEKKDVEIYKRKSDKLNVDKTIVFSEVDENDMDITKSYTVKINHRPLLEENDSCLVPLAGTSKTVLYACGQDDMEITTSHTAILQCKTLSPDKITTGPMDKTVILVDSHNELEMIKSHTVFNDCQAKEETVLPDRFNLELYEKKSPEKPKVASISAKENVFFLKNDDGDHSAAKDGHLTQTGKWSNTGSSTVELIGADNLEVSKSNILENDKDIQKPGFLNEPLPGKSQKIRLKRDETIAFSKRNHDVNFIQSDVIKRNNESALKDREDSYLLPLANTSKTVLYPCGQDDMEITRSYTTALKCKTLSPDEKTIRPMNNTVMFADNQSALEVTKSHTVVIDCLTTKKFLQECPQFEIAKRKTLGVSLPTDANSVQDITKKQIEDIENKNFLYSDQKPQVPTTFLPTNILSESQGEIEINKFQSSTMNEEVMGKVVEQAYILEKSKTDCCHLNSTNIDNHETVPCESVDSNSCLPNVSCSNNLHRNVKSLCDKTKTSDYPMQNDLTSNKFAIENDSKTEGLLLSALSEKKKCNQAKGQLYCAITPFKDQDLIKVSKNMLAGQTLAYSQDLEKMTKMNSEQVPMKLPDVDNAEHDVEVFINDMHIISQPQFSSQHLSLPQQGQSVVNKDETLFSKAENKNLNTVSGNSSLHTLKNGFKVLTSEKKFAVAYEIEQEKNMTDEDHQKAIDFNLTKISDLSKQFIKTHANPREASDPVGSFDNVRPNLSSLHGKTEESLDFKSSTISHSSEQLLELVTNKVKDDADEGNKISQSVAETNPVPRTAKKNKMKRCSLGIFLPRLPNKRNCSVSGMNNLDQIPAHATDLNCIETQPVSGKDSDTELVATKLNISPSQYISEETLPISAAEINSSDSITSEMDENALTETYQKATSASENKMVENCNSQKRIWVQEEDDTQNEKKIMKHDIRFNDTAPDQEISGHHAEGDTVANSMSRPPSSCSSSLDSIKADGTSLDLSTHRNSQMESQFLTDLASDESLKEKLKDGRITLKEFFILLQVHILIQKPRQSNLPAKFTINTAATPEDLMLSQYVYRPKIQIYREDCDALHQKIEELKLSALNQDKLLTDVNKNLWEKMRQCSDEELKTFGNYLNKIKSRFTKMTKVFTHQGKVALYSKLVQSAQNEKEKLQIRIDKMDNTLKKIDNCLTEVEIVTKDLDCEDKFNTLEEWDSEMRTAEKELEQLKAKEEELQRNLSELEVQKVQILEQTDSIQKQTSKINELLDQLSSSSEWDITEWSDDQAVFTFLYDTIELTIIFGEIDVGLPFLDKFCRKITDLSFQSLLDENEAPSSSLLVHKLIFQYIEDQEFWKKKCTTQHHVPKMLQEISLIVSHCRLLGEEIEFLKRWGPHYSLMNIDVNNNKLKLLFSSFEAFAKFEITLSLSAYYPSIPLSFTFQNHIGNTSKDQITAILSKVPLEDNYLKNVVKKIYQDLLQDRNFY